MSTSGRRSVPEWWTFKDLPEDIRSEVEEMLRNESACAVEAPEDQYGSVDLGVRTNVAVGPQSETVDLELVFSARKDRHEQARRRPKNVSRGTPSRRL